MELQIVINQLDFNLAYAKSLVEDLSEEQMTIVPSEGLVNHPAFTLGHLISGSALMAEDLGADFQMPDGWDDLFLRHGPGDPRLPDPENEKYPTKEELVNELEAQHEKVKEYLLNFDKSKLKNKAEWRFEKYMPTEMDALVFMCINHEAMHLGQLAAWRRALGLPSALATL